MSTPRVVAGIMWSGEPQLAAAISSLLDQDGVQAGYFIVAGRANLAAHDELYRRFEELAPYADVLVKLDADMVIREPDLCARAAKFMETNPETTRLVVPVFDHLTGAAITGCGLFNARVFRFLGRSAPDEGVRVFTDRVRLAGSGAVRSRLGFERPPVDHCPTPSSFQSFHFGVHRGVKVRYAAKVGDYPAVQGHVTAALRLRSGASATRDPAKGIAYFGFALGLSGKFTIEDVDYTNPRLLHFHDDRFGEGRPEGWLSQADLCLIKTLLRRPRLLGVFIYREVRRRLRLVAQSDRDLSPLTASKRRGQLS